jgi:Domain of unknown function (DUF4276)
MIGLIVDGEGDFSAFKARYGGNKARILKTDGPRGHAVSERSLIMSAKKQISLLKLYHCSKIAIVTDFEARAGCALQFCKRVAEEAANFDFAKDVLVFAPDKMIENWFLADIVALSAKKKYLKAVSKQRSYESSDGKRELKRLFKKGHDYNEVRHGAELFPLVRSIEAAKTSRSFESFFEELEKCIV